MTARTGPPPCAYGKVCRFDEETGTCPCDEAAPDLQWSDDKKPVHDVPTGDYL